MKQANYRGARRSGADYEDEYERRKKEAHRRYMQKKRKKRKIRNILVTIGLVLSILAGFGVAKVESTMNTMLNIRSETSEGDINDVDVSNIDLIADDEVINILLIGSDKRANQTSSGRSDSTMIATIDMKNNQLKLTSLMRDMYVEIPGYESNRFNAAYSFGGVSLLYQTIATNFGVRLDGYVLVDFDAFENVIDTIGGVDITLTESEYEHLQSYYASKSQKSEIEKLVPGENTMNGVQALCYSRIRKEGNGDFRRTERQREVLQAIFTKAKTLSLNELMETMSSVMPYISTDLTNNEIISYLKSVLMMGTTQINQFRLPVDGTYTDEKIRNMSVLVPDVAQNAQLLQEFIYNKVEETE